MTCERAGSDGGGRQTGRRFIPQLRRVAALLAAVLTIACAASAPPPGESALAPVVVFAAASLQTVIDDLAPDIERATGTVIQPSYASSAALARQIESGAPAELFISADLEWMDYLEERHAIRAESRTNLLGNELVLIAPRAEPVALTIGPGFPLAQSLGNGRLAIAEPDSVPAGRYARAALTSLGVWDSVAGSLAPAENVRAALLLVSRGETPLGIVYRTDALADAGVVIVGTFPADSHPAIVYPIALTATASERASGVVDALRDQNAQRVFERHGFVFLAR